MEKIILWGTGEIATRLLPIITDSIILVVDNDKTKWETIWNGYVRSEERRVGKECM